MSAVLGSRPCLRSDKSLSVFFLLQIMSEESGNEELKSVVAQSLEETGALDNIRAQLRACVFSILSDKLESQGSPLQNKKLMSAIESTATPAGSMDLLLSLLSDVFKELNLRFTASVFQAESSASSKKWKTLDRKTIADELDVQQLVDGEPILLTMLKQRKLDKSTTTTPDKDKEEEEDKEKKRQVKQAEEEEKQSVEENEESVSEEIEEEVEEPVGEDEEDRPALSSLELTSSGTISALSAIEGDYEEKLQVA